MAAIPIRKVVIHAFGGDGRNIEVVNDTIEAPAKHEVQVKVIYSGFSGTLVNMYMGCYPGQRPAPYTPGYCLVGRVSSNGLGCERFALGAIVTAATIYDAQAELVNIPEKYIAPVPQELVATDQGLQQVTGLSVDWNTAYGMVMRAAKVEKGQRVFIHGLSGAVGYATMMLCKLQGAEVYGTASQRNHDAIKELGATPFQYTNKEWIDAMNALGGVHAVFDPLGTESWAESYTILAENCSDTGRGGILVGYGGNKATLNGGKAESLYLQMAKLLARNLKIWSKKRTTFYYIDRDRETFLQDLDVLMNHCKEGKITVPVKAVWNLETAAIREAYESWGKIPGMGSLLIRVSEDT
jgi:synaptic vesicle membrane protein VAT-1